MGNDIADHKRADNALQVSEMRYRRLFETAQDGILLLDADSGQITDVNPFLTDLIGYSKEELLNKRLWNIGFFKDINKSRNIFLELKNKEYVRYEDLPLGTKDGRSIDVEFVSNVYQVDGKNVIQCNVRDITERKRIEKALQESEERYATTLASIGDAIIAADIKGNITFINTVAEDLTGWTFHEASMKLAKDVFNIINEHTRQKVEDPVTKVLENGAVIGLANHTILIRRDGTEVAIDDSCAPIKDRDGNASGVVLVFRDITERKQAEKMRSLLASIVGSTDNAIIGKTLDGTIISWNASAEKIYGYSATEAIGKPISILVPPGHPDEIPQILENIRRGERVDHYETLRLRKDGQTIYVSLVVSPIRNEIGEIVGASTIAADITDRKRAMKEIESLARFPDENPNPVLRIATDGTIIYANSASAPLLELWGCRMGERLPDDYKNLVLESLGSGNRNEIEVVSGRIVFSLVIAPIPGQDYINIYGRDFTGHRQAENALKASEKRYRQIVDTADEGIVAVDEDFIITFVNAKMTNMLGYTPEEMIGLPINRFMFEEDLQDHEKRKVVRIRGLSEQYERRFRRKDGKVIWASISASPLKDRQDRFLGSFAMLTDISGSQGD